MRKLTIVNPTDRGQGRCRSQGWILQFGWDPTEVLVYADHLEEALEIAVDWLVDNAPGRLSTDYVNEEYKRLIAEGKSVEEAQQEAEMDMTYVDPGQWLDYNRWGGEATREAIKAYDRIEVCK